MIWRPRYEGRELAMRRARHRNRPVETCEPGGPRLRTTEQALVSTVAIQAKVFLLADNTRADLARLRTIQVKAGNTSS